MSSKADISGPLRPSPDPEGSIVRVMRQYATSPWTEERIEHVKMRWSQGASARQIARELGNVVSRSAVLGKVHRLGIAQSSPNCGAREHRLERKNARRAPASAHKRMRERDAAGASADSRRQIPAWVRDAEPYIDNPLVDAGIPFPLGGFSGMAKSESPSLSSATIPGSDAIRRQDRIARSGLGGVPRGCAGAGRLHLGLEQLRTSLRGCGRADEGRAG